MAPATDAPRDESNLQQANHVDKEGRRIKRKRSAVTKVDAAPHVQAGVTTLFRVADGPDIDYGCQPTLPPTENVSLLAALMHPLSEQSFLDHCFRECAVYIPDLRQREHRAKKNNGPTGPRNHRPSSTEDTRKNITTPHRAWSYCAQDQLLDPLHLYRHTASDHVFVWVASHGGLIHSVEVADPRAALALHSTGHATYCRAPPAVEQPLVAALLQETGLGFGQYDTTSGQSWGRGEVEIFCSGQSIPMTANEQHPVQPNGSVPASSKASTTGWHYDFQENFTIQLSGVKEWKLQRSTVKHPLRACTPHYAAPSVVENQLQAARLADPNFCFGRHAESEDHGPDRPYNTIGPVETVQLFPGDVLYFPAGMWHCVRAVEPGVSLNISLFAANHAAVVCQALQHLLVHDTEWRASVARASTPEATLRRLLQELPATIQRLNAHDRLVDSILPPVLRGTAPRAPSRREEMEEDASADNNDDSNADDGSTDDSPAVHDLADFVPPNASPFNLTEEEWRQFTRGHDLERNPLALLLHQDEISQYYNESRQRSNDYILNICYAHEAMESTIRVRLRDADQGIAQVVECFRDRPVFDFHDAENNDGPTCRHLRNAVEFLVFHGYLQWVPRSKAPPPT
jgi:Cupin superfamily protein